MNYPTKELLYVRANNNVPRGRVSSTARRGSKWWDQAAVGDVLQMRNTEDKEPLGRAVVVAKELVTLADVLENADHNHVAFTDFRVLQKKVDAGVVLAEALGRAYGADMLPSEPFTILHILPLNGD